MTEREALKRFIKAFGKTTPALDIDTEYWDKFANGLKWLNTKYPDGEFRGYADQYFRAYMLIACIEYEIERSDEDANT